MKIEIDNNQRVHMIASNIAGRVTDEDGVLDINQLVICISELLDSHEKECQELIAKKEHVEKLYEQLNIYIEKHYANYKESI